MVNNRKPRISTAKPLNMTKSNYGFTVEFAEITNGQAPLFIMLKKPVVKLEALNEINEDPIYSRVSSCRGAY